jgi:glycerol-1-phosphate dehydrogenase [NAD(P)+]
LTERPVVLNNSAFDDLVKFTLSLDPRPILVVADEHTDLAAGEEVTARLKCTGLSVKKVLLSGEPWAAADEGSLAQVLAALNAREHLLVAVGSGTITDVTRFVAYQARLPYVSVPTAASVDAYNSITAAITLRKVKHSFVTKPAAGVFANLPTLCAAPPALTASGYGDMLAKFTALADWQLAHLLLDEVCPSDILEPIAEATRACADQAEAIRDHTADGIAVLFEGLLVSGDCMVKMRNSRPAAGAEHSLSHFWEINHSRLGLPESLHGAKTGAASVIIAGLYDRLKQLSREEAARRLARFQLPDVRSETAWVEAAYGELAGTILAGSPSFLGSLRPKAAQVSARLVDRWDAVQAIAAQVPDAGRMAQMLERGGASADLSRIHVSPEEVTQALRCAMYVRDRLTILELSLMLGLMDEA